MTEASRTKRDGPVETFVIGLVCTVAPPAFYAFGSGSVRWPLHVMFAGMFLFGVFQTLHGAFWLAARRKGGTAEEQERDSGNKAVAVILGVFKWALIAVAAYGVWTLYTDVFLPLAFMQKLGVIAVVLLVAILGALWSIADALKRRS